MHNKHPEPEGKYLNMCGVMTLGAYQMLGKTHEIEWRSDHVFFKSMSASRPNLEFYIGSMPVEEINAHKDNTNG